MAFLQLMRTSPMEYPVPCGHNFRDIAPKYQQVIADEYLNPSHRNSSEIKGDYKNSILWRKSYELCLEIYGITATFPMEDRGGLACGLRKSALSVPSYIAEGYGRKDYIRMLYKTHGSVCELDTLIQLAGDLDLIEKDEWDQLQKNLNDIQKTLKRLIHSLENKPLNTAAGSH